VYIGGVELMNDASDEMTASSVTLDQCWDSYQVHNASTTLTLTLPAPLRPYCFHGVNTAVGHYDR